MKIYQTSRGDYSCTPEGQRDGWKGEETRLLENLNAYYSHRRGYILPASKIPVLEWLLARGWTGATLIFDGQPRLFFPPGRDGEGITFQQLKKYIYADQTTS